MNRYEIKHGYASVSTHKCAYLMLKRALDFIFASLDCVILALPMLLIAISVRLDSEGGAIFTQTRLGKDGKPFKIYKFRTMYVDAPDSVAASKMAEPKKHITRVGAILRRTSADELPQLYNIILGDMSFVGYRPICPAEENINFLRHSAGVFTLRPGITGLAQISGRDSLTDEEKVRFDSEYTRKISLKTDIYCLVGTVAAVISGKGVN